MNLIETNYQINMTYDHSVSNNSSFKRHLNVRASTSFKHCSSCAKHGDSASVSIARVIWTYDADENSTSGKNCKEPSSLIMSPEVSFDGDKN